MYNLHVGGLSSGDKKLTFFKSKQNSGVFLRLKAKNKEEGYNHENERYNDRLPFNVKLYFFDLAELYMFSNIKEWPAYNTVCTMS